MFCFDSILFVVLFCSVAIFQCSFLFYLTHCILFSSTFMLFYLTHVINFSQALNIKLSAPTLACTLIGLITMWTSIRRESPLKRILKVNAEGSLL